MDPLHYQLRALVKDSGVAEFRPGMNIHTRENWQRAPTPTYSELKVCVPARLHFGMVDHSRRMRGGQASGGGIGTSLDACETSIIVTNDRVDPSLTSDSSVQHLIHVFEELLNSKQMVSVCIENKTSDHRHMGLGSHSSKLVATALGINVLYGWPFSLNELYEIIVSNYVESSEDGEHVHWEGATGVGILAMLYGGVVWVRKDGQLLERNECTGMYAVYGSLDGPAVRKNPSVDDHIRTYINYRKTTNIELKRRATQLAPAFHSGSATTLFENLHWFSELGNFTTLSDMYDMNTVSNLCEMVQKNGALFCGISSRGPTFFAICASQSIAEPLLNILDNQTRGEISAHNLSAIGGKYHCDLKQ